MIRFCLYFMLLALTLTACEETDYRLAAEAGLDAVKALSLSEEDVRMLSQKAAQRADQQHQVAPAENPYAQRLKRLTAEHQQASGLTFSYKVYLSEQVNAFAMADGSIRFYSGLMDMLDDQELLFVIGHEMGHVLEGHVKEKMTVALLGSALRKGIASQQNIVGELARSSLGDFLERFVQAQFSQEEEKAADDHALDFMNQHDYNPARAISVLNKLAQLGKDHTFLSSHPAPKERAQRLQNLLQSPDSIEIKNLVRQIWETIESWMHWIRSFFSKVLDFFHPPSEPANKPG